MKRLAFLLTMLLALSAYAIGEGPDECLVGQDCHNTPANPEFSGTVTGDFLEQRPQSVVGGSVCRWECDGGGNCPTSGNENEYCESIPGDSNPLNRDVDRSMGGSWVNWGLTGADIKDYLAGDNCLTFNPAGNPPGCNGIGGYATAQVGLQIPPNASVVVPVCNVWAYQSFDSGDYLDIQFEYVAFPATGPTGAGDSFRFVHTGDGCSPDLNCSTDAVSSDEWFPSFSHTFGSAGGYIQIQVSGYNPAANALIGRVSAQCWVSIY